MEYVEFIKEIKNYILKNPTWNISEENYKFYPDGYTAKDDSDEEFVPSTNVKYNHVESDVLIGDFISLYLNLDTEKGMGTFCRFSVKYLYDEFSKHGWDQIEHIINENIKLATDHDIDEIMNHITDYEFIKNRLIVRPINFSDNRYDLKDCVYKQIGDIALVLYILLYENDDVGLGTVKAKKSAVDQWKKDYSEIWEDALLNTNVWAPPRMYTRAEDTINPPYTKGAFMALTYKPEKISPMFAPTITTTKQQNGAIAMFYPGVQEKLAKICGGSYYIAFTSIHDVRIHPVGTVQPRKVLSSLKDVNKMFNQPADILSRKVFIFDNEKKKIEVMEM